MLMKFSNSISSHTLAVIGQIRFQVYVVCLNKLFDQVMDFAEVVKILWFLIPKLRLHEYKGDCQHKYSLN
jgi:hypothetical protein